MFRRIFAIALLLVATAIVVAFALLSNSQEVPEQPQDLFIGINICSGGVPADEPSEVGDGLVFVANAQCHPSVGTGLYVYFWDGGEELRWLAKGPFSVLGEDPYIGNTVAGEQWPLRLRIEVLYRDIPDAIDVFVVEPRERLIDRPYEFVRR